MPVNHRSGEIDRWVTVGCGRRAFQVEWGCAVFETRFPQNEQRWRGEKLWGSCPGSPAVRAQEEEAEQTGEQTSVL